MKGQKKLIKPIRLLNKYKSFSAPMRASILFALCNFVQKGISFITTPIFTRIMPSSSYGQYSIFLSWFDIICVFTTLNMWNYLINNGLIKYKNDQNNFISALQGLSSTLTLAWLVIYIPFSNMWESFSGLSKAVMFLMFGELLLMPSFEYYCAEKRFYYDAKPVIILSLVSTILTPIISIPLILFSQDKGFAAIFGRVLGHSIVYAIVFLFLIKRDHNFFNKEYWTFALKFNLPLIPHFLSMMILNSSDRIMIERMCGKSDAALYSVAYSAGAAVNIINGSILNSFVPYTYQAIKNKNTKKIRRLSSELLILIGAVNLLAVILAPEIIAVLAPGSYRGAIYVIPPVAMSNMYMFLFNLFANVEYYWGKTKYVAVASCISAGLNVLLNYVFIRKYGFIAAGYTTLICYILFGICHYVFMRIVSDKYMNGTIIYNTKMLCVVCVFFTVLSLIVSLLYDFAVIRYSILIIIIMATFLNKKRILYIIKNIKE